MSMDPSTKHIGRFLFTLLGKQAWLFSVMGQMLEPNMQQHTFPATAVYDGLIPGPYINTDICTSRHGDYIGPAIVPLTAICKATGAVLRAEEAAEAAARRQP